MFKLIIATMGVLALAGCAGSRVTKPAVCDGKHRRPANLYGTILPTLPVPQPASRTEARSMVVPDTGSNAKPGGQPPRAPDPGAATPAPVFPAPDASSAPAAEAPRPQPAPRTSQRGATSSAVSC